MSAEIEKLWPLYFGNKDDELDGDDDDVYRPGHPWVEAIESFVEMFMEVRRDDSMDIFYIFKHWRTC